MGLTSNEPEFTDSLFAIEKGARSDCQIYGEPEHVRRRTMRATKLGRIGVISPRTDETKLPQGHWNPSLIRTAHSWEIDSVHTSPERDAFTDGFDSAREALPLSSVLTSLPADPSRALLVAVGFDSPDTPRSAHLHRPLRWPLPMWPRRATKEEDSFREQRDWGLSL